MNDFKEVKNFRSEQIASSDIANVQEDEDSYIYTLSFASELPYLRYFGYEVIDVNKMDLSRLNNSAPVLFNHDPNKVIGVIEKAWVKDDIGYCEIRLSKTNEEAVKIKRMMDEGILGKVSFGYSVINAKWLKTDGDVDFYKFEVLPYEVSIVTIPADDGVGVEQKKNLKRELEALKNVEISYNTNNNTKTIQTKEVKNMNEEIQDKSNKFADDVRSIIELGTLTKSKDLAMQFIEEGRSFDDFKKAIAERNLSSVKATDEIKEVKPTNERSLGAMILDNARNHKSFGIQGEQRNYDGIKLENYGKELVGHTFGELISNIKNEYLVGKLGFDVRDNIRGNLIIPALVEAPATVEQTEEDKIINSSRFKTAQYTVKKETHTLSYKVSYELLKDATPEYIERYLLAEALKAFYTDVNKTLLGKLLTSTIVTHTATGTPINYADIVELQDKAWVDNDGKFLVSKKLANRLKTIPRFEGTLSPIYDGTTIDGEEAVINKIKPKDVENDYIVYGDMSKFVVALFGPPDIYVSGMPDDKNQVEFKIIGYYGAVLTDPSALAKATIQLA